MEDKETVINKEFDCSNIIPEINNIAYIVQYCNNCFNQFLELCEKEEEKNKMLKYEFKNYEFKKTFKTEFRISAVEKKEHYSVLDFKDYNSFLQGMNQGSFNNIESLVIKLDLSFKRGPDSSLEAHNHEFIISFKPYQILFKRKSNYDDEMMLVVENNINAMLSKFPTQNTIFCSK